MKLTQAGAQAIVNHVALGEPPDYNHYYYSSGLEPLLTSLARDYLNDYLAAGGSAFKLLVGASGSGKTHLCYALRDLAWQHNYAVAYLPLTETGAAFADLAALYQQLSRCVMVPPYGYRRAATTGPLTPEPLLHAPLVEERGLASILQGWYARSYAAACCELVARGSSPSYSSPSHSDIQAELERQLAIVTATLQTDNANLTRALLAAFEALVTDQPNVFAAMLDWLHGEGFSKVLHKKRQGILEPVSARNALSLVCGVSQWLRFMGYGGLIILLDAKRATPQRATKTQIAHLINLLGVVNDTANQRMNHVMWVYATADSNFLEGGAQVHLALKQRLTSVFNSDLNPSGVYIDMQQLLPLTREHLEDTAYKLAYLHEVADRQPFDDETALTTCIDAVVDAVLVAATSQAVSRKHFVQVLSRALNMLRLESRSISQAELSHLLDTVMSEDHDTRN